MEEGGCATIYMDLLMRSDVGLLLEVVGSVHGASLFEEDGMATKAFSRTNIHESLTIHFIFIRK